MLRWEKRIWFWDQLGTWLSSWVISVSCTRSSQKRVIFFWVNFYYRLTVSTTVQRLQPIFLEIFDMLEEEGKFYTSPPTPAPCEAGVGGTDIYSLFREVLYLPPLPPPAKQGSGALINKLDSSLYRCWDIILLNYLLWTLTFTIRIGIPIERSCYGECSEV